MDLPGEEWLRFDNVKMERSIAEYMKSDGFPIPSPHDREGYFGGRHYHYWLSGLKDYLSLKEGLDEVGNPLRESSAILDLGCASGRVLRHFACHEKELDLWGADINTRHVEWVRRFLAPSIKVFPATIVPHLPLEDNTCSLVYAFSVFTHIDELELAWIAEIRRILRRGGVAWLTIHSDHTWRAIERARPLYDTLLAMKDHIQEYRVTPELFKVPMPTERVAFRWTTASIYNTNVFHSTDYIRREWGRFFEVLDIKREGHSYQDVVVMRKD
jgi:SAM-dependent methyltransferase